MSTVQLSDGVVHKMPAELREVLLSTVESQEAWEDITPLARNEFICWVESAKQDKTRKRRIRRTKEELLQGKRRPCCWAGCIHRQNKPMSPSQKWVHSKSTKHSDILRSPNRLSLLL